MLQRYSVNTDADRPSGTAMKKAKTRNYKFKGSIWKHKGPAAWHFITLPRALSKTIRKNHGLSEEGWGRLKTTATIGKINWQTAIWYDSKFKSYLLPIKASIRKSAELDTGILVSVTLLIREDDPKFSLIKRF